MRRIAQVPSGARKGWSCSLSEVEKVPMERSALAETREQIDVDRGSSDDPVLLVPADDVGCPIVSIVVPALNESLTIGDFVDWCGAGLADAGVDGEILIVDSSTDDTADDRGRPRRSGAQGPEARAGPCVHRRVAIRPGQVRHHGRRRLHLRLPRAQTVRRAVPSRATSS